jgi:hypothetical protein
VLVDRPFVEGVDHGDLGRAPCGSDLPSDRLERLPGASGEEDPGALPREGPGDAAAESPLAP